MHNKESLGLLNLLYRDRLRTDVTVYWCARMHRLTMFKSTLLHASDGAETFKEGYKNRRINFTMCEAAHHSDTICHD
jgi:predicted secreted protein